MYIQVEQKKYISVCELCARWFTAGEIPCQWKMYTITANVSERHTLPNKIEKVMYISKREQKRRLQKLWHKSAEEQMQAHYLQQEERAFTLSADIERNAFEIGKGVRIRKRAKNTFSKEEAGTCGTYIATKRFQNSRLTCVCKSRNMY